MPKPILYRCQGVRTWMLSRDFSDGEGGLSSRAAQMPLLRDVDVETTRHTAQAALSHCELRGLNKHRPKWDSAPSDGSPAWDP